MVEGTAEKRDFFPDSLQCVANLPREGGKLRRSGGVRVTAVGGRGRGWGLTVAPPTAARAVAAAVSIRHAGTRQPTTGSTTERDSGLTAAHRKIVFLCGSVLTVTV